MRALLFALLIACGADGSLADGDAALARGDLELAAETLAVLAGSPAEAAVREWLDDAAQRVACSRALGLLKARSDLMHAALYK